MITNIQTAFEDIRNNCDNKFHNLYSKANNMAEIVGKAPLTKTRMVGRQNVRNNVVSNTPEDHWRRVAFLPFIDCVKNSSAIDFKVKLSPLSKQSKINLTLRTMQSRRWSSCIRILQWRPSKSINFSAGIKTMETILGKWKWQTEVPSQTISVISEKQIGKMFPNVMIVFEILLSFQQKVPVLKDQIRL